MVFQDLFCRCSSSSSTNCAFESLDSGSSRNHCRTFNSQNLQQSFSKLLDLPSSIVIKMGEQVPMDEELRIEGTVGFIGCGNMAKGIAFPLFKKGILDPSHVIVSATSQRNLKDWAEFGCQTTTNNADVFQKSDILLWSVKPQIFPGAICALTKQVAESGSKFPDGKSIAHISIMAGITLANFQHAIENLMRGTNGKFRCFRTMPNIGLKVSCGVAVFTGPPDISESERALVHSFFRPVGLSYEVPEHQINAYGGLFGSGIGFMFPIIEALSDGGVKMGIPRHISLEIAAQVMKGAGELILQEKQHPGPMKDTVCSPGGTTIAGVAALEAGGVRSAIINAVEAATVRGQVLGAQAGNK